MDDALPPVRTSLDECLAVVDRLHKMCCDPQRSPRMAAIEETLMAVRRDLEAGEADSLDGTVERLQEVGGQLGRLQVLCCAPKRMPLYAEALAHLNTIQLGLAPEMNH